MKYIYFQWIRLLKNKIAAELRVILLIFSKSICRVISNPHYLHTYLIFELVRYQVYQKNIRITKCSLYINKFY